MSNSVHRSSSTLHTSKLHQKQIFNEARESYYKASSLHISRQLSKLEDDKREISECVQDVIHKSYMKIAEKGKAVVKMQRQTNCFAPQLYHNNPSLKRLQVKAIKLKNRIETPEEENKVQRKLKEISYINNQGHKQRETIIKCSPRHKKINEVIFGQNEIVNKYWNALENESNLTRQMLTRIKENRVDMLIRQHIGSGQDMAKMDEIKQQLEKKLLEKDKHLRHTAESLTKSRVLAKLNKKNVFHSLDSSIGEESPIKPKRGKQTLTRQLVESSFIDYLKHKRERKQFLSHFNQQLIEKEDVYKIYAFVKGGYNLDPDEIEGDFISLKRFNQSKEDFITLNQLYKAIKDQCYASQEQIVSKNERTFKAMVYLNELQGKIAPNALQKLMKHRKIVK